MHVGITACCLWNGCNELVKKALQPTNKAYEELIANETLIKIGGIQPAVNQKDQVEFSTQRMGVDNAKLEYDGMTWQFKTSSSYNDKFKESASESEKFSVEKLKTDLGGSEEEQGLLRTRLEYLKGSATCAWSSALVSYFWQFFVVFICCHVMKIT